MSVTNLEIMCKDGAYTNCTDGYSFKDNINPIGTATAPRWDVAPLMCYDNTGRTIYMLTNTAAPWRRFSSGRDLDFNSVVPQGSGTFRGIVVADDVAPIRFGDLGRYQLRAMTAEEIALTDEPFSKTVVEWNWNDRKTDLIPEIGEGEINKYGATQVPQRTSTTSSARAMEAVPKNRKVWWQTAASRSPSNGGISTPTRANTSTSRSPRRESVVRTWSSASSGATAR